jgi:Fic family protein
MEEKFLKKELKELIKFANDKGDFDTFVHPVIKAIIIHFWI